MLKEFFLKKLLASKMKDVPEEYQEKAMSAIAKNPQLFMKIAEEAKKEMGSGKGQLEALMAVAKKYENELRDLL